MQPSTKLSAIPDMDQTSASPGESSASPGESFPGESSASPNESLEADDLSESCFPDSITFDESVDPVDLLVHFVRKLSQRPSKKFPITPDRDRLMVTLILAILADPHHHLNKYLARPIINLYLERGGRIYRRGIIARSMTEADQFDHTVQYLYDYGLPIVEIARALGTATTTVHKHLKYMKEEDQKNLQNNSTES